MKVYEYYKDRTFKTYWKLDYENNKLYVWVRDGGWILQSLPLDKSRLPHLVKNNSYEYIPMNEKDVFIEIL